jgi:hypothetical protein
MRQERPTCRDVYGGAIALRSNGKRTGQRAGEVRLLHHLWTPIRVEPSAPCALWTQADRTTTAERRQTPPIGTMARMVLDLLQGLDHDCGTFACRPLSSLVCDGSWAVRRPYALRYAASAMRVASRAASVWADTSMRRSLAPASAYAARPSRTCGQLPMRCSSAGSARPSLASTRA